MCNGEVTARDSLAGHSSRVVAVADAVGLPLAHDITEIRPGEFKGRAFRRGQIIRPEDVCHLQRLGKEKVYVLSIADDEMHEDEAAFRLAAALMGPGVISDAEPKEGRLNLKAARDGLLKVKVEALDQFNMLGEVMCATLHTNTVVRKGDRVAGTRAIPLVIKKAVVESAVGIARGGLVEVKEISKARAGVVITGNEVYHGRIKDAFGPIIRSKIERFGGEIVSMIFAPDDEELIETAIQRCLKEGADLLVMTGGMSVDPDDVTRFAVRKTGAKDITYGSAVLPGAMLLVAYLEKESGGTVPILGVPACAIYHRTTVFDLILPRILAGERVGLQELAKLGHGGLCLGCDDCRFPLCPFGK